MTKKQKKEETKNTDFVSIGRKHIEDEEFGKYYLINAKCGNCDFNGSVWVRKTCLFRNVKCPKCECLTLERKDW